MSEGLALDHVILGVSDLHVRFGEGEPALKAVGLTTASGEVVVR